MQSENRTLNSHFSDPEFCAELRPYRSLGKQGFVILMAVVVFSCLTTGTFFLVSGAWPITIFLAIDVLLIWGAFTLNYRSARIRERISIWRDKLLVECLKPDGSTDEHQFNPFWTRFDIYRHEEFGITRMCIVSRKQRLQIGSFLNPADRESFASAFSVALGRAKGA